MARHRKQLPEQPFSAVITDLSNDGRGVGRLDGKTVFIQGGLPGEELTFTLNDRHRHYDEGTAHEILQPAPDRVTPRCPHFGTCGGCALQHLAPASQIDFKQSALRENLRRVGKVEPEAWLPSLKGPVWAYRRKARLSVRWVAKKERVLVGFRERYGRFVTDCRECHVLVPELGFRLGEFAELIGTLDSYRRIPQLEVACGDNLNVVVIRHLDPLSSGDREKLVAFEGQSGLRILLQAKGPDSVRPLTDEPLQLRYKFQDHDIELQFNAQNFIQINAEINHQIVNRILELLAPDREHKVLDLYCGLGNFTLPVARYAGRVTGVEGDPLLVEQAKANAASNGLPNTGFHSADLNLPDPQSNWLRQGYDKVILDPPRSGAQAMLAHLPATGASQILYISCHPSSLARDAGILVNELGYKLAAAAVMDMFPHTAHVESMALFERR